MTKSILELPMDEIAELFLKMEKAKAVIADKDSEITKLKQLLADNNIDFT